MRDGSVHLESTLKVHIYDNPEELKSKIIEEIPPTIFEPEFVIFISNLVSAAHKIEYQKRTYNWEPSKIDMQPMRTIATDDLVKKK